MSTVGTDKTTGVEWALFNLLSNNVRIFNAHTVSVVQTERGGSDFRNSVLEHGTYLCTLRVEYEMTWIYSFMGFHDQI